MFGSNSEAREQWRRVHDAIHAEEQQLKELQLDYAQKVAVVEGLKIELRRIQHETQDCVSKEAQFNQQMSASVLRLKELDRHQQALERDRELLAQQLAAEQEGVKSNRAKIEAFRAMMADQAALQAAFVDKLLPTTQGQARQEGQQQLPGPDDDTAADAAGSNQAAA